MKSFDLAGLSASDAYKLMRNVVTPRPIALVTTVDEAGVVNAAPFSFFNAIAFDPCMVVLGLEARPDGSPKDTSCNIRATREFVVNMVDRAMAEKMNLCSTPLPPGESEIPLSGFTTALSEQVAPPRIAEAPAVLECTRHTTLELGNRREIVVGEVKSIAVRDDLLLNEEKLHIDHAALDTIARLGANFYATSRDTFEMVRPDGR
ncbi:flavin reductase family protein [Nisaea acidiphila]|uniref:Flavin reductase family protein n=1 Tax=Nisaea acidiphila TaxID=1862145 RepID=A0A9J7AMR5_9PROT|nr:flavin reductase family protein [Nisaea acidiphila]UUX48939.1 flavin reductase family protein [Nisaea acidiphila]